MSDSDDAMPVRETVRQRHEALRARIQDLRAAFLANPKELELETRGFAITDALAALNAAAVRPGILDLMGAVGDARKVLGAPGHYGYSHPVGKALGDLYEANIHLDRALETEVSKEGGAE